MDLEKFQKFFKKSGQKFKNFSQNFRKNFIFFRCFLTLGASVTTWLTAWASQITKSYIRLAAIGFWKRPPSPPTAKKNLIKIELPSAPMLKFYFYDPHYFSTADNFYHGQQRSKVNHFGENRKKFKKSAKIMTFQKILTSMTSDFYARNNSPTCAWSMLLLEKSKKIQKSAGGGDDFKKVDFWPPQPAKKWRRSDSIDMGPKNLSFSRQIRAACKNLANSKGGISSTWVFVQGGLYRQRFWRIPILERAGPLPLP